MLSFFFVFLLGSASHATPTAQPESLPLRVVFIGGEWSAGTWTKPKETVSGRFAHHLERFLEHKIQFRSAVVHDISEVPTKTAEELKKSTADYVFYFCDHSSRPVEYASRQYAPWESNGEGFFDYLGRQIGAIRLGSKIGSSGYPEDILLNPMTEIMQQASRVATFYGARFILLWPGFSVAPFSWDVQLPGGWPYRALSLMDFFKSKPRISSERLNYHLRMKDVAHVSNLQLTNYFSALREAGDLSSALQSHSTSDKAGEMLATSVVSQEF